MSRATYFPEVFFKIFAPDTDDRGASATRAASGTSRVIDSGVGLRAMRLAAAGPGAAAAPGDHEHLIHLRAHRAVHSAPLISGKEGAPP
ncbi:hypothetical protein Acsp06_37960 [Actinomycetospora sp. NBRC 106375]|uniref:hypothetical protein n=1 Tax=Actinomycetospora sp. NBRC 106375 TaxID=3032207 RepID=UPI0024A318A7|nr:hypothetical protein [Actinomycetospora sp. NBRC 106375]GLZ47611.1 hypothetical protein Acsp06_37960 [Actinomycetospora sp. NBRC 106375]